MKRVYHILLASLIVASAVAQPKFSQPHGLYDVNSLTVTITGNDADAVIRYTTDGSEPTQKSTKYTAPLTIKKTTLLRAVEVKGDSI